MKSVRPTSKQPLAAHARGFVLMTSLIFLMVLSVLALMAMRGAIFGERIGGNERDMLVAREAAELALRDAEFDIFGKRFDGVFCAPSGVTAASCGGNKRPAGTRPTDATDAGNFWTDVNKIGDSFQDTVSSSSRPSNITDSNLGVYSVSATAACGKALWLAADWDAASPPTGKRCTDGSSIVRTVIYGEFTGAPNVFGSGNRLPRYLIEAFTAPDLNMTTSGKTFYRITAVGFGRVSKDDGNLTSVTLQSVYAP